MPRYHGYRFPPEIISHAIWLSHRFCLSFRDTEGLLAQYFSMTKGGAVALCNFVQDLPGQGTTNGHDQPLSGTADPDLPRSAAIGHAFQLIRNQQVDGSNPFAGSITNRLVAKDLRRPPLRHHLSDEQIMSPRSEQMSPGSVIHDGDHRAPRLMP